jgi:hypothetical protein
MRHKTSLQILLTKLQSVTLQGLLSISPHTPSLLAAIVNLNNARDDKARTNNFYSLLVRYFPMVTIHNVQSVGVIISRIPGIVLCRTTYQPR